MSKNPVHTRSNDPIFKTRPNVALHNFMKKVNANKIPTVAETNYFLFMRSYLKNNGNIKKMAIDLHLSERNVGDSLDNYGFIEEEN